MLESGKMHVDADNMKDIVECMTFICTAVLKS